MATLVERARQVISADEDAFFNQDTILYYLNKSQKKIMSYLVQQEVRPSQHMRGATKSLRGLDKVRKTFNHTVTSGDVQPMEIFFTGMVPFPTDLNQILYMMYDGETMVRELNSQKLFFLQWGNLKPTKFESYYYVTADDGERKFQVFIPEDPETGKTIKVFYVKEPADIVANSTELVDLPDQLVNAVIYGAALMMLAQESVKDPEGNLQVIMNIYQEELQSSVY